MEKKERLTSFSSLIKRLEKHVFLNFTSYVSALKMKVIYINSILIMQIVEFFILDFSVFFFTFGIHFYW